MLDLWKELTDSSAALMWRPHGTCHFILSNAEWRVKCAGTLDFLEC